MWGGCSGCVGSDCKCRPQRVQGNAWSLFPYREPSGQNSWQSRRHGDLWTQPPNRGGVSVTQLPVVSAEVSARNKEALLFLGNTKEGKRTEAWKYVSAWVFIQRKLADTIHHCQSPRQTQDVFFFFLRLNVSPCSLKIWFLESTIYDPIASDPRCSPLKRKISRTYEYELCRHLVSSVWIWDMFAYSEGLELFGRSETFFCLCFIKIIQHVFPDIFSDLNMEKQTLKERVWKYQEVIFTYKWATVAGNSPF